VLAELCVGNVPNGADHIARGVPNPYVPVEDIIGTSMKLPGFHGDAKRFVGLSYHLSALVNLAARRNRRRALEELWRKISRIVLCEYEPKHKWHYLIWISKQGEEKTWRYDSPQSWSRLRELAMEKQANLPRILYENSEFLYFFLLVFPHRLTSESLRLVDEIAGLTE